jgi:hypothetical protein
MGNLVKQALSLSGTFSMCFQEHENISGCSAFSLIHAADCDAYKNNTADNRNEYPIPDAESEHWFFLPIQNIKKELNYKQFSSSPYM